MRRRVDARTDYDPYVASRLNDAVGISDAFPAKPPLVISEVPELWRTRASQPWRVLFPDLDWWPE
jgi:hypothetical protein